MHAKIFLKTQKYVKLDKKKLKIKNIEIANILVVVSIVTWVQRCKDTSKQPYATTELKCVM